MTLISLKCQLTWVSVRREISETFWLRVCLVAVKCFPENTYFPEMLISRKGKCIQAVWLSRKSFYGKSIPVFGSSKHFTEIVLRKINSGVSFVQTFYGKYFTENQFPCLVRSNILRKIKFVFYGKSISVFGVYGSFYGKYEMCYKFKHLHYLDKPVTVQN